jgi:protein phosphatase
METNVTVDAFGLTDRGRKRETNEDQFLLAKFRKVIEVSSTSLPDEHLREFGSRARAHLFIVADGLGGMARGERASSITLDAVAHYITCGMQCFYDLDEAAETDLTDQLIESARRSHDKVRAESEVISGAEGMATTLTMAHVIWPRAYVVHVGDSRCYHVRGTRIRRVTTDQTVAQSLVADGVMDAESAENHPMSHVLTQAVGGREETIRPEISNIDLALGDTLLLCTDGLTKHVSEESIARHAARASSAREACEALVNEALTRGGTDNVTVAIGRFS